MTSSPAAGAVPVAVVLKEHEAIAKDLVQRPRGTQVGVYDVQFRRMEAEIWLNEEKAR